MTTQEDDLDVQKLAQSILGDNSIERLKRYMNAGGDMNISFMVGEKFNPPSLPLLECVYISCGFEKFHDIALIMVVNGSLGVNSIIGRVPLLHAAIRAKSDSLLNVLIQKGADVNIQSDDDGWPTIHVAIQTNRTDRVALMLENGASVMESKDRAPLTLAVSIGNIDVIRLLIHYGANVNPLVSGDSRSPLMEAIEKKRIRIAELLIKAGANVNAQNEAGTVLYYAALNGSVSGIELLIDAGADMDYCPDMSLSPLQRATLGGNIEACKTLLERGAKVDQKSCWGMTALHYATENNWIEIASLLVSHGANPEEKKDDAYGFSAWELAQQTSFSMVEAMKKAHRELTGKE